MITVIPAVLEKDLKSIQEKVEIAKQHVDMIQLDVMDGRFVPNTTYNEISDIATLDIDIELHLMIEKPSFFVAQWASLDNVKRVIFHYEAAGNVSHVAKFIRDAGKEVGVAINPQTSSHDIAPYLDECDMLLVMGVNPGFSGQDFNYDVLEKIKEIHRLKPELPIAVDGSVNSRTRDKIVDSGATILCAASYLWNAEDLGEAIKSLR